MSEIADPQTLIPWSEAPRSPQTNVGAAIATLPGSRHDDPFDRLLMAFLLGYTRSTARAYLIDLQAWAAACREIAMHPFDARRYHVDLWVRRLESVPLHRTGRPMASASIARRLSAVSAYYDYGISVDVLESSPVSNVRRPKVPTVSTTVALSAAEAVAMLQAAEAHSPRAAALVSLLAYNGVRINEVLSALWADYTYQQGRRVLRIKRKGDRLGATPLNPVTVRAIDSYLLNSAPDAGRWLFMNRAGTQRLAYSTAFEMIRSLAHTAGIPAAADITPHSFRHMFATEALAAGIPLQDVQDALGHADPRTTRRYDQTRDNLDRHPTYRLASYIASQSG